VFDLFKGICTRGIYDNMKTAVETIFVGKRVSTIAGSQAAYEGRFPSARSISFVARYQPVVAWMLLFWWVSFLLLYNTYNKRPPFISVVLE
jgi:hypothetical protein